MSLLQNSNAMSQGGTPPTPFEGSALRFNAENSNYLSRTFTSAGDRKKWTLSLWFKRGTLDTDQTLFSAGTAPYQRVYFNIAANGTIDFKGYDETQYYITAMQAYSNPGVYKDPTSWYHLVIVIDSTIPDEDTDRLKIYLNGELLQTTPQYTYLTFVQPQNEQLQINNNITHVFGRNQYSSDSYFDGLMTQINFIDGYALTASDFGELVDGQWIPKTYEGDYGTTGFYLPFNSGTSTTTLGLDASGNGNNWTLNNFTRTVGKDDCWLCDYPANSVSAVQPNGNYCILNPLDSNTQVDLINANLQTVEGLEPLVTGSFYVDSGSWYWEIQFEGEDVLDQYVGVLGQTSELALAETSNVIGIAFNRTTGILRCTFNGIGYATISTDLTTGKFCPFALSTATTNKTIYANFGQRPFSYVVPAGYKALCAANLPVPGITNSSLYFNSFVYRGLGISPSAKTGLDFTPDLVWIKNDGNSLTTHLLTDRVRGIGLDYAIATNSPDAQDPLFGNRYGGVISFNSDGFTTQSGSLSDINIDSSAYNYVTWNWKGNNTVSTNTAGFYDSQVCPNLTSGFSIFKYTPLGFSISSVGHGLNIAPRMIIIKNLSQTLGWIVWHSGLDKDFMLLNSSNPSFADDEVFYDLYPGNVAFPVGNSPYTNGLYSTNYGYAFTQMEGFSKIGNYYGNGDVNGPFVFCGFRPKYLLIKNANSTTDWMVFDTSINVANPVAWYLNPGSPNYLAFYGNTSLNFTANGFKVTGSTSYINESGSNFIYMAIAEKPFNLNNAF